MQATSDDLLPVFYILSGAQQLVSTSSNQHWNHLDATPKEHPYLTSALLPSDLGAPLDSAFMLRHSKDEELCKQLLMDQDSRKEEHIKFKRSIESKAKAFRQWRAREGANQLQMEDNSNIKILVSN